MTTIAEVTARLGERTRPETAAFGDPVGLQLGDPTARVETVAVCHEVTEDVVETLAENPVDLLVTYHPLIYRPVGRLLAGRSASSRAFRLIKLGVGLLVVHSDFDAAPGGTADALAAALGLANVGPVQPEDEGPSYGRAGEFEGDLDRLVTRVSSALSAGVVRVSGKGPVHRIAVFPGSGSDHIDLAASSADTLVTGDLSHHETVRAMDLGLTVIDPGHIATERPGMTALVALVASVAPGELVNLTHIDPETWAN